MAHTKSNPHPGSNGNLGFEAELWLAADQLRGPVVKCQYRDYATKHARSRSAGDTGRCPDRIR